MAGVCFYFEENDIDVYSGRTIDLDAWNYAVKAAGDIDKAIVINKTDIDLKTFDADINFEVVKDLPTLNGRVAYLCTINNNVKQLISLWDFDHNVDWYVFGPANGWGLKELELGVHIPVATTVDFHAVHAATVVFTSL